MQMSLENYSTEARQILNMTRVMLELASVGEWEKVTSIEAQRSILIHQLFANPQINKILLHIAETMEEILHLNDEILRAGQSPLSELKTELSAVSRGRRALGAYKRMGNT